jgi:aldose 1-epimerase
MNIYKENFGKTKFGEEVTKYIVEFSKLKVEVLDYGCTIKALYTPNREGELENIVLGFDSIKDYEKEPTGYLGAVVGRIAGRTEDGVLEINGIKYQLAKNNGRNNLHGGINAFHNRIWESKIEEIENKVIITFRTFSPHLEEGFPSDLYVTVKYIIEENSITIEYEGIPEEETYLTLTNHVYFNLSGNFKTDILRHQFNLNAKGIYYVDKETLPTFLVEKSEIFTPKEKFSLEKSLSLNNEQMEIVGNGYDHPFLLSKEISFIDGEVENTESGRKIEFVTDQPIVVLYTGNYLDTASNYKKNMGFCLETQDYPNIKKLIPEKMSIYSKNNIYKQKTTYKFLNIK